MSKVPDEVWNAIDDFVDSICDKMEKGAEKYNTKRTELKEKCSVADLLDEAKEKVVNNTEGAVTDCLRAEGVLLKPFEEGYILSTDVVNRLYMNDNFNIDVVLYQLEDYGKFKGVLLCNGEKSENYIPVSVAKQIVRARGRGGVLGYLEEKGESKCTNMKSVN